MDVNKMIAELRIELAHIEEVIAGLERLALGGGKRRGRPPAWLKAASENAPESEPAAPKRRGRPPGKKKQKEEAES